MEISEEVLSLHDVDEAKMMCQVDLIRKKLAVDCQSDPLAALVVLNQMFNSSDEADEDFEAILCMRTDVLIALFGGHA